MIQGAHALSGRRRDSTLVLALLLILTVSVTAGHAAERLGAGALLVGLELQQRSFDTMSVGDSRPAARSDVGVRGSIDWLLTENWALGLSAHFSGTWFDWSDPLSNSAGKIEDAGWDARFGIDRVLVLGGRAVILGGVGVEYGESHSWVHNLGVSPGIPGHQNLSDEGPRCYRTGGYARLGASMPLFRRTALCAQVSESFYGAHASDPPFGTKFNWLGRSLALSVGLRFEIARGRPS